MIIPLDFQKFQITDVLLLTQYKQVTSKLNKKQFGTVITKAYGISLRPNLCRELSAQRGNSGLFYLSLDDPFLNKTNHEV